MNDKEKYEELTTQELRNRLKHIAGLCYSLSVDLSNLEIETDYLRFDNDRLRKKLEAAGVKQIPKPPESFIQMKNILHKATGRKFERSDNPDSKIKCGGAPKGNQNAKKKQEEKADDG